MKTLILALSLTFTAALADETPIPLQGFDGQTEVEVDLPRSEYSRRLNSVISGLHESSVKALASHTSSGKRRLQTFVIGAGLGIELKAGPLLKLKAVPRIRLVYSRDPQPIIP